jgi:hypothetical protein
MKIPALPAPCMAVLLLTLGAPWSAGAQPQLPEEALTGRDAQYQQGFRNGFHEAIRLMEGHASDSGHHGHSRGIRIGSAIYGSPFGTCNFTQQLAQLADGQSEFMLSAGNDWCGDPSHGNFKVARVRYACGHRDWRQVDVRQGQSVNLRCD